nr:hypothetical protein [Methanonatronarchaeum thermophilum]
MLLLALVFYAIGGGIFSQSTEFDSGIIFIILLVLTGILFILALAAMIVGIKTILRAFERKR